MDGIGADIPRVEGLERVTGRARYTADLRPEGRLHAMLVESDVPSGRIMRVLDDGAKLAPGVRLVLTHLNMTKLNPLQGVGPGSATEARQPLQDDRIVHHGQHLALVVADTLERAQHAASLLRFEIECGPFDVRLHEDDPRVVVPPPGGGDRRTRVVRGDVAAGLAASAKTVERTYTTPTEHHNPMETVATTAEWRDGTLHLFETSRQIKRQQEAVAHSLGLPKERVRVESRRVGGAFGAKGFFYGHILMVAVAARTLGRPVSLVTTRRQMFGTQGHRPRTIQRVTLGADAEGRLKATRHLSLNDSATISGFVEPCGLTTQKLYATESLETGHRYVPLELSAPIYMRGPGEAPGPFALESAMDELAHELGIDPVELRLRNDSTTDADSGKPWSQRRLRECFERASARFGWARRDPKTRAMRDGHELVGYGCAGVAYRAGMQRTTVRARMEGEVAVFRASASDVGQGVDTVMAQIAADVLGLPVTKVRFLCGDSDFPPAPGAGGSVTAASVGNAVVEAAKRLKAEPKAEVEATHEPKLEDSPYAFHSWGAAFAEVGVDEDLGTVRCRRFVGVYDIGRALNPRLVRSQLQGGVVWAIGMALHEHTAIDFQKGLYANRDLAEYHVPVAADVPDLDVSWLDVPDPHFGSLGARGIGEVGIAGAPAALANAVYHATGKRVRDLPITLDRLL